MARSPEEIVWTGDLNDDCVARWYGYVAHCEVMSDCRVVEESGERLNRKASWGMTLWWFAVSEDKPGGQQLFSSADVGGSVTTGALARAICEQIMRGFMR